MPTANLATKIKVKCPRCNKTITKSKFCPECGKELETDLTENQKQHLKRKKILHQINLVTGGILGAWVVFFGIMLIIIGIFLSFSILGVIVGIPMIIIGVFMLLAGRAFTGSARHSRKKAEEIGEQLNGTK